MCHLQFDRPLLVDLVRETTTKTPTTTAELSSTAARPRGNVRRNSRTAPTMREQPNFERCDDICKYAIL
jgi:hypothetical protein